MGVEVFGFFLESESENYAYCTRTNIMYVSLRTWYKDSICTPSLRRLVINNRPFGTDVVAQVNWMFVAGIALNVSMMFDVWDFGTLKKEKKKDRFGY